MGVTQAASYEERPIFLNPEDIVVFYTDGVTEVFDSDGKEFGVPNLTDVIRRNREKSSKEILEAVYRAVKDFAGPQHVFDDLTMVVLKRLK